MLPALQRRAFRCAREVLDGMPKTDNTRLTIALKTDNTRLDTCPYRGYVTSLLLSEKSHCHVELVKSTGGILYLTEKIYAKLVSGFLENSKMNKLVTFLIKASKEESPTSIEKSVVVQVMNACISINLLDQAHDILDEIRFSGIRVGSSVYSSLIKSYCMENRQQEIEAFLRDARKAGVQLDSSCYEALIESDKV